MSDKPTRDVGYKILFSVLPDLLHLPCCCCCCCLCCCSCCFYCCLHFLWLWAVSGPTKLNETKRRVHNKPPLMAEWIAWLCMSRPPFLLSIPFPLGAAWNRIQAARHPFAVWRRTSIAKWISPGSEGWNWLLPFGERTLNFNVAQALTQSNSGSPFYPFSSDSLPAFCLSFLKKRCVCTHMYTDKLTRTHTTSIKC